MLCRLGWLPALLLLFLPTASPAIQLHWISGETSLNFTAATRCTLVVQADSAATLPAEWRLLWVADSVQVQIVALDSLEVCAGDTASVYRLDGPSTPEDSTANRVTAHFCSGGSGAQPEAAYVIDLPESARGKLKVVYLDPADSTTVIESNEATFNGGIEGTYAPAILRVTSDHSTTTLRVEAIGADLTGVRAMSVSAPELQSDVSLAIESANPSSVVASASIPIPLPNSTVLIQSSEGVVASGVVPADVVATTEVPDQAYYSDPAYPYVYPKDFAFINAPTPVGGVWRNLFHIFYIRHLTDTTSTRTVPDSTNEVAFGHAWSRDLINWDYTANSLDAFHANTDTLTAWDHAHVWAPSIVQFGTKFLMFYTGVAENGDQTIGYAVGDSIYTTSPSSAWSRRSMSSHSPPLTDNQWVSQNHPWQFRDPFVMPDPQNPTSRLLMFYTAKTQVDSGYAVGVARSAANDPAAPWTDLGFYPTTNIAHTFIKRLESPHVFPDSINWAPSRDLFATWRIMFTMGDWDFPDSTRIVFFDSKVTGTDVTDRTESHWSTTPTNLYDYLHLTSASPEYGHQASEMLNIGGTYFWAGFNGADIRFRRVTWDANQFWLTNVGQIVGVQGQGPPKVLRLALVGLSPSRGVTRFRIDTPARMRTSLMVYDVMGRRVRSLVDREMAPGSTEVTWDGRDQSGSAVGTGMYFARMVAAGTSQVVRVPLVR
jgi:hypothetical protein